MDDLRKEFFKAVLDNDVDKLKRCIDLGVDVNFADHKGRTALHLAAFRSESVVDAVQVIVNFSNHKEIAAGSRTTRSNVIQCLLEHGCKPNEKDKEGKTPYMLLKANSSVLLTGTDRKERLEEFRSLMKILEEYDELWQLGLPLEVKRLDEKSAKVFASLLEEEGYEHYEARIMVAGEPGTGKTTIARYLVGDGPTKITVSTDGIDLYNGLSFIDRETEEWLHGKQDFTLSEVAISRSLRTDTSSSKNVKEKEKKADTIIHNSVSNSKLTTDNTSLVTDKLAYRYPNEQYIATKEQFTLKDSINDDKDDLVVNILPGDEEDNSFAIKADTNTLPGTADNSTNTKIKCSSYTKDTLQAYTDDDIKDVKHTTVKAQREPSTSYLEESTEKTEHMKITITQDTFDENQMQTIELPATQTEDFHQTVKSADETKKEIVKIIPLPVLCNASTEMFNEKRVTSIHSSVSTDEKDFSFEAGTETKSSDSSKITEVVKNPGIIGVLKKFFGVERHVKEVKVFMTKDRFLQESLKVGRKKLHQRKIVPVIIWDFGGQDVFYSTHQTFLTYRAIYLIVLDGSRTLDDPCPFEEYLPGKSGHKTARDYLKFWINTIVTYCKGGGPGFPKIIIVLTHKDKVKAEDVELKRQQMFFDIEKMFSGSTLLSHLVIKDQIFVNALNAHDPEMATMKKSITEQAFQQPTWGQELPKCFISLDVEFDSLTSRNILLITMEHMRRINSLQPVRPLTEDEIKVFLKFQHSFGRILYFDEPKLNKHIILAPTYLIDAFKSIVTDRRFCAGDRLRQESWNLMSTKGVIAKKSIEDIWQKKKYKKFQEHKEYLVGVMTHLDILVEPKRYDQNHSRIPSDFYYVASMVRTSDTTDYLKSSTFGQRNIGLALCPSSSMIPPALSFRFISYCLSMFAIKTYGQKNEGMLFHRSAVFTIDPSLDMYINCDDEIITVRLVHVNNRSLIIRDLASSIRECLTVALEKICQLYIRTCSSESVANGDFFNLSLCCSSPEDPCLLPIFKLQEQEGPWICPKHEIEHTKDLLSSWEVQQEELQCGDACPVANNAFLEQIPSDINLRRLSVQYNIKETRELAIYLGMQFNTWDDMYVTLNEEPERLKFETLRRCIGDSNKTFNDIKNAIEIGKIQNLHSLCKVVRGKPIDFDKEPEKWDLIATEEHLDRVAPLVGNNSLSFLVELGMEFKTWEQVKYRQKEKDLVKLNRDILQEWKSEFCVLHQLRPSLRYIGQAFNNIDKSIKIIENVLADLF